MYSGFPRNLLHYFRCLRCRGALTSAPSSAATIWNESVVCASCNAAYEICEGILALVPAQQIQADTMFREMQARDEEAPGFDGMYSTERNEMEIPSTLAGLPVAGSTVLDFGCGTGRVTSNLIERASTFIGVDLSRISLKVFAEKIPDSCRNAALAWADTTQIALAPGSFDLVLSMQVLEHVPTPELRNMFLESIHRALRPGGNLRLTAYHHSLKRRLKREPRDGFHPSGIFFHCFTIPEFRALVLRYFEIDALRPVEIHLPYIRRIAGYPRVSRFLENVWGVNRFGNLVLVSAHKSLQLPYHAS